MWIPLEGRKERLLLNSCGGSNGGISRALLIFLRYGYSPVTDIVAGEV